ncbi:zinc-finger domain-containing protein [Myroides sp. NP-2]
MICDSCFINRHFKKAFSKTPALLFSINIQGRGSNLIIVISSCVCSSHA